MCRYLAQVRQILKWSVPYSCNLTFRECWVEGDESEGGRRRGPWGVTRATSTPVFLSTLHGNSPNIQTPSNVFGRSSSHIPVTSGPYTCKPAAIKHGWMFITLITLTLRRNSIVPYTGCRGNQVQTSTVGSMGQYTVKIKYITYFCKTFSFPDIHRFQRFSLYPNNGWSDTIDTSHYHCVLKSFLKKIIRWFRSHI